MPRRFSALGFIRLRIIKTFATLHDSLMPSCESPAAFDEMRHEKQALRVTAENVTGQ